MAPSSVHSPRALENLTIDECWRLVAHRGFGRVVYAGDNTTQVVPTTYEVTSGTAYFRAPPFGELARRADRHVISLQVDDIDRRTLTGWSVQMSGRAHRVEDAATVASLWSLGRPAAWIPGAQTQWIALPVDHMQGQRVSC